MKKITLLFLIPLFFACDINNWEDTVITNNSSHEVTFKFSNTGEIVLSPLEEIRFKTEAYQYLEYHHPFINEETNKVIVEFIFNATDTGYIGFFKDPDPEPAPEP